jgi:CRP/FNR family transcriptional regulator
LSSLRPASGFILSEEGKEITLYRLFERDICLFSASCMLSSIQFEIMVEAEKDTELWVIPTEVYRRLMEDSAVVSNYTNQIMASRFSDVMWLMDQILFQSFDRRLSQFLLEESGIEGTDSLKITHERISNHMGRP